MTSLQARSHGINGIQEVQGDNRLDCTLVHRDLAEEILGGRTNPCSKESWDGPRGLFLGDRVASVTAFIQGVLARVGGLHTRYGKHISWQ